MTAVYLAEAYQTLYKEANTVFDRDGANRA